jgi:hypothetical protein
MEPVGTFKQVKGGVKPRPKKAIWPIKCYNSFSALPGLEENDEKDIRIVGDSVTRKLLNEFCGRNKKYRSRYCFPGAGVCDVAASIDEFSKETTKNTTFVVHVGTNDINKHTDRKELRQKFGRMIEIIKGKSKNVLISGILPILNGDYKNLNYAYNFNRELKWLCDEKEIKFVNAWDQFYNMADMYDRDGVHPSELGATRFARILNDSVKEFFR